MTKVKSSKVKTILQRNCNAKSHMTTDPITSVHCEACARIASGRGDPRRKEWSPKGLKKLQAAMIGMNSPSK